MTVSIDNIASSIYFLTGVPDVTISTQADKVHVRVVITGYSSSDTPVNQYYFTSGGFCHLFDICDLCKVFLEANNRVWCTCQITATVQDEHDEDVVDTASFKVFYESIATGRNVSSMNDFFLITTDKKILYKHGKLDEFIGFANLHVQGESSLKTVRTVAVCSLSDGTTASVSATDTIDFGSGDVYTGTLQFTYNSVLQALKTVNSDVTDVLSFRLELDNRTVSYVVSDDDTHHLASFYFRNHFGMTETIALPGAIKEVHDISQNVTVSGHTRIKYDLSVEQSFQFQSAALPSFLEPSVLSLLIAESVTVWYARGIAKGVLITDSTWEPSNEIGTVNSVKLTYKFKDDRVIKYTDSVIRIFNNVYDNTYG
jgi:hypothetical protein